METTFYSLLGVSIELPIERIVLSVLKKSFYSLLGVSSVKPMAQRRLSRGFTLSTPFWEFRGL